MLFWYKKRNLPSPFIKEIIEAALEMQILLIQYSSKDTNTNKEIAPIGVYANDGFWYMPAVDISQNETRIFRLDRIITLKNTLKKHNHNINLDHWLESLISKEVKDPIHLSVKLTREGIRQCSSQPWIEPHIKIVDQNQGSIDIEIDRSEVEFVSNFFLQLGVHALVIKPQEVIDTIGRKLHETLLHYDDSIPLANK